MQPIALVGPELEENLSLRSLGASLSATGFSCDIVPYNRGEDLSAVVNALRAPPPPRMVGLSLAFQPRARDFLALAVALRRAGYGGHLTAGGHYATFACRDILRDFPEFDTILRHEADEALPLLAAAVMSGRDVGRIPGLAWRAPGGGVRINPPARAPDVAALPWPDRRGGHAAYLGHRVAALVGSRGCYAGCAFCSIAAWHREAGSPRFRLRPVEDVAGEMKWLRRTKGVEVFIFHDDNFFLPRRSESLARIHALGDALAPRWVGRIATVVKARPNDLDEEIVAALKKRLGLVRMFLGIETDAALGLRTLGRGISSEDNHRALALLESAGVYPCFNMLVFDPSTTIEDFRVNLRFMARYAEVPHNFGRVELYAGTPLLERLQAEGRAVGDYLGWDYRLPGDAMQRVFEIAMRAFYERNFSDGSAPHRLMGTRFMVEIARHFHPGRFDARWLADAKALTRRLTLDSVGALEEIVSFVTGNEDRGEDEVFAARLAVRLRAEERVLHEEAARLEASMEGGLR